jgi:bifunctional UDP-N-acetylglucosamine pyrophosphorylase/glucosamine-1-phosphate N-acetyltransferase
MAAESLRIAQAWIKRGVLIPDPASVFIDPQARLGKGTRVEPFSFIQGKSIIGKNCLIGPMARIRDCRLGDGVSIEQSVAEASIFKKGCVVGPFARVRPGCVIGEGAHLGNFCEFKKAKIGRAVKAGHLSYLGDTVVGDYANIGAGTITANYDGKFKHQTKIGKRAFTGSGTVLVAPLSLGDFSVTGAGAVVLKGSKVPKRGVVVGVPAKLLKKKR